ncbi:MAG: GDSL family lipase [Bacteroidetes bacterium]|uniref:GDSL family lipase n=1 Tax=Candidatus Cryptobacteroides excrementipullorum TaxID=2840761 RepID=A0A9D9ITY2_9BACT|nr:GDSL family lipase [Candidatus Cryptobacteroides excrementipullorum]
MKNLFQLKAITMVALVAFLAASGVSAKGQEKAAASDGRIMYNGRVLKTGSDVSFDWSGVNLKVRFTGTYLAMRASDSKANYFNVWIDSPFSEKADRIIRTSGKDTTIILADNLKRGEHEIIIQKRTEGEQGTVTLHEFTAGGKILQAMPENSRYIEFVGDSYTCGFGTESSDPEDPFTPETENCNLAYAAIISRYFDADYSLVCHSGQGVARNYDDFRPGYTMVDRYSQVFDESTVHIWDKKAIERVPDLVVVYLGANDFSTEKQPSLNFFTSRYVELLGKIKDNYGDEIPVLCLAAKIDPAIFSYVKEACARSGMKNISYATMQETAFNWDSDLGARFHPNYTGQKKMASIIIPYVSTATGWEMKAEAYR